ncbi:MAG: HlyD family type I secretion periplasmic adaptor subunit [Roseinatronobacter sp.]
MSIPDPYSARAYLRMAAICILVLILGLGGWAFGAQISSAVVAQGQIDIDPHRQIVQHPEGGVVTEIFVREGDSVSAGSLLIHLDTTSYLSERAILETRYLHSLAHRARLEAERAGDSIIRFPDDLMRRAGSDPAVQAQMTGQQDLLDARQQSLRSAEEQLTQRRKQVAQQIDGLDAQLRAIRRQRALVIKERDTHAALLERGLTQAARGLALDRELARLEGEIGALNAARATISERAQEAVAQVASLHAQHREETERALSEIRAVELELTERLKALDQRITARDVIAPIAGIVHDLQVTRPHTVLRAGDPALFLIPQDIELSITARVTPETVRQIHVGQTAVIVLPGPDMRATPQQTAQVSQISADRFTDELTQQPFFRVQLALDPQGLVGLDLQTLTPGQTVEVFFETGQRRPISYLTTPLTGFFRRALREG